VILQTLVPLPGCHFVSQHRPLLTSFVLLSALGFLTSFLEHVRQSTPDRVLNVQINLPSRSIVNTFPLCVSQMPSLHIKGGVDVKARCGSGKTWWCSWLRSPFLYKRGYEAENTSAGPSCIGCGSGKKRSSDHILGLIERVPSGS
jgi:hypothetical protein